MKLLTVSALLYSVHHDIFGSHKGQLCHYSAADYLIVYYQTVFGVGDVEHDIQYRVNAEERLSYGDTLVCRVIEGTLEPLSTCGECGVEHIAHNVSRQRADTLVAHRIALVSHSGRADLVLFKRLFNLLEGLEYSYIVGKFHSRLSYAREYRANVVIHLARVGLARNGYYCVKAHLLSYQLFKLLYLIGIALKKLHEGSLSTGSALRAEQFQLRDLEIEVLEVGEQFVAPKCSALAYCGELCGLEVGVSEAGHSLVLIGKFSELRNYLYQLSLYHLHSVAHDDNVGVVANVAGSSAGRLGSRLAEGVNVRHNVVANYLFARGGYLVVDIINISLKLIYLLLSYGQAKLHLSSCKRHPKLSPGSEFLIRRENILHFLAGVASAERAFVRICHNEKPSFTYSVILIFFCQFL